MHTPDEVDIEGGVLRHPHFSCGRCGADNVLEVDSGEGYPQDFVWDCERCCHPHDIRIWLDGGMLMVSAEPN